MARGSPFYGVENTGRYDHQRHARHLTTKLDHSSNNTQRIEHSVGAQNTQCGWHICNMPKPFRPLLSPSMATIVVVMSVHDRQNLGRVEALGPAAYLSTVRATSLLQLGPALLMPQIDTPALRALCGQWLKSSRTVKPQHSAARGAQREHAGIDSLLSSRRGHEIPHHRRI